jgi:phosphate transport system substrate-binding protein
MRILCLSLLLGILCLLFPGCQKENSQEGTILINGSTTIFDLSKDWADAYMQKNPGTKIEVSSTGSKKGIENFIGGKIDIAESSRKISAEEILKAKEKNIDVGEFYVGFNIYCIAVNPDNPVDKLDKDQIKDIFSGKIKNWKDIGGNDGQIEVLYRTISEGDYDYFLERFIDISKNVDMNNLPSNVKILQTPQEIVKEVARNKNAIGYFLIQSQDNTTKSIAVAREKDGSYLKPSVENATKARYPVLRPYYMYISKYSQKPLRDFIDFIYSDKGAEIARKHGFIPVPNKGEQRETLFEYI